MLTPEQSALGRQRKAEKAQALKEQRLAEAAQRVVENKEYRNEAMTKLVERTANLDPVTTFAIEELVTELVAKYGLSERQEKFFLVRWAFSTDTDAAKHAGIGISTITAWRTKNNPNHEDYNAARKEYQERLKEITIAEMSALGMKAVRRTEELLDATIEVKGRLVPDRTARAKGVEIYSRWSGLWSPKEQQNSNPVYVAVMNNFTELLRKKADVIELNSGQIIDAPED